MSKHHHYHQSQSGSYHTTKKSHLNHTDFNNHHNHHGNHHNDISEIVNEMIPQHHHHHTQINGMMTNSTTTQSMRISNGNHNGEIDTNDTNNNYNKHHHSSSSHNHRDGKRSASISSGHGDASSSKRTKLNNSSSSQSVPSEKINKYGNLINLNHHHQSQQQQQHGMLNDQSGGATQSLNNSSASLSTSTNGSGNGAASQHPPHYNVMEKLKELYRELKNDKTSKELHLSSSSFLLDKLVTRERLNTLIVNLYPGNKGYSLAFRAPTSTASSTSAMPKQSIERETIHETPSWLYDNAHLLDALDAEELPPLLIDFCNAHCPHLFYNGAIIAQIRDYRQSYPLDICDIHYVLLKPTSVALWDEINGAVDNSWSIKERTALESQLVLATAPPICLDPSPSIGIAAINATTERSPIASHDGVIKMAKKFLQVTKNRNNKLEKKTHYPQTALANHIANERRSRRVSGTTTATPRLPQLKPPLIDGVNTGIEGINFNVKNLPMVPPSQRYDWQPRNTERLTFETDRDNCQYRVRVELFERPTTCEVSGQLTLERQKGGTPSGRMCPFKLASPLAARRYVKEFMGIFTEEGRKFVKITHERETRAGREVMEMQTGEKLPNSQPPKIQTIPIIAQSPVPITTPPQQQQQQPILQPTIQQQPVQQIVTQQILSPPSTSLTSPPPPALVATPAALKIAAPQRIIAARPTTGQQVVVLAQVKPESAGNQVIKNLLNQPRAPMTNTMVNGLNPAEVQTVYLQVDNSNLIHMGSAVPANLQFQQLIATPVSQTSPQTYTMNVQAVTPQQVTVVKRHRDM